MKSEIEIKEWLGSIDEMIKEYQKHLKTAPPEELQDFDLEEINHSIHCLKIERSVLISILK